MMKILKSICNCLIILGIFSIVAGCISAPVKNKATTAIASDKYITIQEADEAMPTVIVKDQEPGQIKTNDDMPSAYIPSNKNVGERKIVSGHRVQLYTTKNESEANTLKVQYEEDLEMDVYIIYDAPYFKLRIGNCLEEIDCDELLNDVRRKGYDGAWIVKDKVSTVEEQ